MIRRPPRSTLSSSSAASDVYKRQGLAAIAMVAFLSSCGKVPQAKVDATNAAITAAQTAEAAVYVPAAFAAVQDSMKAINASVEVQKSKLFKKFGPISLKLDATLALANKAAAD